MTPADAGTLPDVGPQIRIDVNGGTGAANETTGAVSSTNPDILVAAWNDWRESAGFEIIRIGVACSEDGGQTWDDFLLRPPAPNQTTVEGDPYTAYDDRTGTVWVGGISFANNGGLFVSRREPGDTEFSTPVMARVGFVDKAWMVAGPRPGLPNTTRLYIAYNEGVIWSDDMGDTWTPPTSLGSGLGFQPQVGPNGQLYISYWNTSTDQYLLQRSLDGGDSFTTHVIATRMDDFSIGVFNTRFPGTFRVPPLVYIDVQPNGRLAAVFFDTTGFSGGNADVDLYFCTSADEGETWSTPSIILDDISPGDQFFPYLESDPTGRLHLLYFDSSNTVQDDFDQSNPSAVDGFFDAYYAHSENTGSDWTTWRLTPQSWNSELDGLDRDAQFIGDYLGMAVTETQAFPIYLDTTNGDTDTYTNVITFSDINPDVNGDGVVDVSDLTQIILQWGDCPDPPAECSADTNGDGEVGVADLTNVILNWS